LYFFFCKLGILHTQLWRLIFPRLNSNPEPWLSLKKHVTSHLSALRLLLLYSKWFSASEVIKRTSHYNDFIHVYNDISFNKNKTFFLSFTKPNKGFKFVLKNKITRNVFGNPKSICHMIYFFHCHPQLWKWDFEAIWSNVSVKKVLFVI